METHLVTLASRESVVSAGAVLFQHQCLTDLGSECPERRLELKPMAWDSCWETPTKEVVLMGVWGGVLPVTMNEVPLRVLQNRWVASVG